ncbi:hypothetical protein HZC21_04815 [Candidatus Peregrinibacteria bacterium]|nr:hypothetical protein [Candidatus Peregrinibacteria bacterium]
MKKILIPALIIIVSLSGCTFFQKKEEVPSAAQTEIQLEKKIGLVSTAQDQGLLTGDNPFMLVMDSAEKIFIDSVSINLKRYKNRRVEIEGKFEKDKSVFHVENVTSLGNETQVKKLYQNSQMGIKFNYPSIWVLKEVKNILGSQKILITPYEVSDTELSAVDSITVEISENNKKLAAREWLNLNEMYQPVDPFDKNNIYQQSFIGVAQLSAVKKTTGTGEKVEYFINRDNKLYRFSYFTVNDADKDVYRNAFFDLVASFEFIPFASPAGEVSSTSSNENLTASPKPLKTEKSLAELAAAKKAAEEKAKEIEEAAKKAQLEVNAKQIFIDYIKKNISALVKEPASLGGTWFVQNIEFAFPEGKPDEFNAIYVVYEDGHDLRKILLSVPDRTDPAKMQVAAYFKPGDSTDWVLAEGADTAKDNEKSIGEIVVKKGMQLLEAKSFKIKIQYPSSWYWAYAKDSYSFSNKPVTSDNVLVKLEKNPSSETEDKFSVCKEIAQDKYCLVGVKDYEEIMKQMLETIQ